MTYDFLEFRLRINKSVWLCVIVFCLGAFTKLEAYTDPGTGLLIWQIFVGTLAGGSFLLRKWIRRMIPRSRKNTLDQDVKR